MTRSIDKPRCAEPRPAGLLLAFGARTHAVLIDQAPHALLDKPLGELYGEQSRSDSTTL